ncbi:MAG: hypothetical protein H6509_09040 [Bryobacterales bacterium]|nr:hypothetical protein [Acidobacteriota bacterium]MCB9384748.1 hypothetical protein [Bryobacterales bacterium]
MSSPDTPTAAVSEGVHAPQELAFGERAKGKTFKETLKQPVFVAAFLLFLGIIGLIFYLERGRINVELPPPEVTYELLPNQGLTEGVPIAIKINQVSVFQIDDPMQGGSAARAKEVVAAIQGAVQDLVDEPGRVVTLDVDSSELPAIVQDNPNGGGRRVLIQLTQGDVTLSGQTDPKWLARSWAERVTDAFKVFVFGEAPMFSVASDYGEALQTMHTAALQERGAISLGSLNRAYDEMPDAEKSKLANFPPPDPPAKGTPGATPDAKMPHAGLLK